MAYDLGDPRMDPKQKPKAHADVFCRICFKPEGISKFVRVGKYKVQHTSCLDAWLKEDADKGLEHLMTKQLEIIEQELLTIDSKVAENIAQQEQNERLAKATKAE